MNAEEMGDLLAFAALYDNRKASDPDVVAWLKAIGDLPYADAEAAVAAHYGQSTERIMPGHVRQLVKAMRRDRIERGIVPVVAPELAGDPGRFRAELRAGIRQLADGMTRHLAIAAPVREGPPPEEFTEARKALGPALPKRGQGPLSLQEQARQQAAESRAGRGAPAVTELESGSEGPAA